MRDHRSGSEKRRDSSSVNRTARDLGYDDLTFLTGDIAELREHGVPIDMVVTLHACDTATDYALINAVKWHSRVILFGAVLPA